jgi:ADP-heptose:LPS heptosyltransferase
MDLFSNNKKSDMEFVSKKKLKKIEFDKSKYNGITFTHFEPMRQNRWALSIPFQDGSESYFVTTARPTKLRHGFGNKRGEFYPHNIEQTWDYLYIEIRDYIGDNSKSKLYEWLKLNEPVTWSHPFHHKKNMTVEMLDPTGVVVEKWNLIGCLPIGGTIEIDETEKLGISLSIDHAILIL